MAKRKAVVPKLSFNVTTAHDVEEILKMVEDDNISIELLLVGNWCAMQLHYEVVGAGISNFFHVLNGDGTTRASCHTVSMMMAHWIHAEEAGKELLLASHDIYSERDEEEMGGDWITK